MEQKSSPIMIQAAENDFDRLVRFYRDAIDRTENMKLYGRWVYGQHPTDEMIRKYLQAGAMYDCEQGGSIVSAVAVTPNQEADYHDTEWALSLADDEEAVAHILCVEPKLHRQGVAKQTMRLVMDLARSLNKKALRLDALACNTPAHRLYASLGFQCRGQQHWYADNVGWADFFLYELIL